MKIQFTHYRIPAGMIKGLKLKGRPPESIMFTQNGTNGRLLSTRGGQTVCTLTHGLNSHSGVSLCSLSDNYDAAQGRKRALLRALMNAAGITEEIDQKEIEKTLL